MLKKIWRGGGRYKKKKFRNAKGMNQEFFSQADTGSYFKGAVVTSACLLLKLVMLLLCICEISQA